MRQCLVAAVGLFAVTILAPTPAAAGGPHFFGEFENGVGVPSHRGYGGVGYSMRVAFGAGGDWEVLPFELYGVFAFAWTRLGATQETTFHIADVQQDAFVYSVGIRAVVTAVERLRFLFDIAGGYREENSSADIDGREHVQVTRGQLIPIIGLGIQVRVHRHVSVGVRSEWWFMSRPAAPDLPLVTAGVEPPTEEPWQTNVFFTVLADF